MLDVFLLGLGLAYARLNASIAVSLDSGAICFVSAALLSLISRATLDVPLVWRLIAPDRMPADLPATNVCLTCHQLLPETSEGLRCPRCTTVVRRRRPASLGRALALLVAAALP